LPAASNQIITAYKNAAHYADPASDDSEIALIGLEDNIEAQKDVRAIITNYRDIAAKEKFGSKLELFAAKGFRRSVNRLSEPSERVAICKETCRGNISSLTYVCVAGLLQDAGALSSFSDQLEAYRYAKTFAFADLAEPAWSKFKELEDIEKNSQPSTTAQKKAQKFVERFDIV
jgi:hypothetical protein